MSNNESSLGRETLIAVLATRLGLLFGLLLLFTFCISIDNITFFTFMGVAFVATVPYSLWLKNKKTISRSAHLQFAVDVIVVSGLVYFTGGLESKLSLLYPLVILSAGIISPLKETVELTVLSMLMYTLVLVIEPSGALDIAGISANGDVAISYVVRISMFAIFGLISGYLSQRCRFAERDSERWRFLSELIFENIDAGLALLNAESKIVMVNTGFCEMTGYSKEGLLGHKFFELMLENDNPSEDVTWFLKAGGSSFPARMVTSDFDAPREILNYTGKEEHLNPVTLVVVMDESDQLEVENERRALERNKAAAEMATNVAQEIRTPLTAISGGIQLLSVYKDLPESEKEEIFLKIVDQSERIDKAIQKFLNYAEFSKQSAKELIDLDLNGN